LFSPFTEHFVDPAFRDFADAQSADSGKDEISQDALLLIN
jgi:hypothetical protein